jgi:hypothetical protein
MAVLEDGYRRFHEAPSLRVRMIQHYKTAGNKDAVNRLQLECIAKTPYLRRECQKAGT